MTSSISLQTSNLVDTDVYELAEGGTLWKFNENVTHTGQTDSNTIKPPPLLGLQPGKSVVFACLEIVVCTLARYCPSLINQLAVYQLTDTSGEKRSPDRNYIVPETACSNSCNAPCVLASAIRCLLSVPDLCAPRVLLSGFNVIGTSPETDNPGPQCFDNLLLVLLDILVNTAQLMLLLPLASSPLPVNKDPKYGIRHRFDQADLTDIQGWMAHNALTLCGLNGDDVEITSTATSAQFASAARRQRREQAQQRYHIDTLVGWTWQQSQLADALVCLGVRLATHHYPTLTNPRLADHSVCIRTNDDSRVDAQRGGTSQPDSSEIRSIEQTSQSNWVDTTLCASNPALANDWYGQVASSRIPNCYLATITLVSRVAAQCPLPVFESKELRNSIVDQVCRAWKRAALLPSDCTDLTDLSCMESHTTPSCDPTDSVGCPRGALFGLKGRRVCLAAIGLLVNHREPAVNAFFIRTLTPQLMLLLPLASSPLPVNKDPKYGIRHRFDQADLTDIQGWMAHNALTLCGLNGDDVEITSTATSAQFASAARRQRREQAQQRYHIDTLVGWTWQQSQLADALVCLGVRLATHHYPTLTNPRLADHSVCIRTNDDSRVDAQRGGTSQPDSSEIRSIEQTSQSNWVDTTLCASNPALANDWYGQVAFSMLRLLRYEKMKQNEIFRWIYDLSLLEQLQPFTDLDKYQVAKDELSECLHAAIDILESLIDIADSSSRQGLLLILVPLLCNLLLPSPPSNSLISRWCGAHTISAGSAELSCGLHLTTIQHLISIAPRFPAEFRSVFGALGELRPRLEMAIKSSATVYHGDPKTAVTSLKTSATRTTGHPVIELKTDFSDFTKS
ncbi:hypothetical protein AHF37_05451 [Paragonimus kellicotti]|nr:hypothetical protein AHF37_05451 [Paragonimus kellicotti]